MEQKTQVTAVEGTQVVTVTRDFDLPVELLFKAHTDPDILGQWMGTNVLTMEAKPFGNYQFETTDGQGNVLFRAAGVFHTFVPNQKITRTFEMENVPFGIQLELTTFEKLTDDTSRINIRTIYETVAQRDQVVQFGMAKGIAMAHDRLVAVVSKLK